MIAQTTTHDGDLFNEGLIRSYVKVPRFVERPWLEERVEAALNTDNCRFVLLTAEPGAGKTAFMAWLAHKHPEWPRYFIRRDQRTPLEDGGERGFLEKIGFQLAAKYPKAFQGDAVRIAISQTIERADGQVTGAEVDRLVASPFYDKAIQISQDVKASRGNVTGIRVRELVTDPNRIPRLDLQRMALLAPALAIQRLGRTKPIVILLDALDELRYRLLGDTVLDWLTQCPELPANVRILVTSRPDPDLLATFRSAQHDRLVEETIPERSDEVRGDLTTYASSLAAMPAVQTFLKTKQTDRRSAKQVTGQFVTQAVERARGNLGYLDAVGRAVDQAFERQDNEMLARLLDLNSLPVSLEQLFGHFLNLIWQKVQNKSVVVKDPLTRQHHYLELWPAAYGPILGVLSVAYEMLNIEQIRRLGRIAADTSEVAAAVGLLGQFLDSDGDRYRFYHASFSEFLTSARTRASGHLARFAIDPAEWHAEIVAACTEIVEGRVRWKDCGKDCDPYGLRLLVTHIQARLALPKTESEGKHWAQAAYAVILDEAFRTAQREILGDLYATLADLRTALSIALERDDLIKALECAGVYRYTKHTLTITSAIFEAVQEGDFERALQRSKHYEVLPGLRGNWERALQLYLAWEAAERGDTHAVRQIMGSAGQLPSREIESVEELWDALLTRIARTLERMAEEAQPAREWLAELVPGRDPDALLAAYDLAQADPPGQAVLAAELSSQMADFGKLVDEGNPEAISMVPLLDVEKVGERASGLRGLLVALAATDEGQADIDQALQWVLPNPYPRYRDIGLIALGIACLAVPDPLWAQPRLQRILDTALNREGVTFTFNLPAVLLEEARKRGLPAEKLSAYLDKGLAADNNWGTAMRAHSARAAGSLWQGKRSEAFAALEEAGRQDTGFAGYGTLTLLSLANRCYEFGDPDRATAPVWGTYQDTSLVHGAGVMASRVRDPQFREERVKLAQDNFRAWADAATPDAETALDVLAGMADPDERGLYIDHVTARWAIPGDENREAIKKVVPLALPSATTLDTVLGRLFGLSLGRLSDAELAEAVRLCANYLLRPDPGLYRARVAVQGP